MYQRSGSAPRDKAKYLAANQYKDQPNTGLDNLEYPQPQAKILNPKDASVNAEVVKPEYAEYHQFQLFDAKRNQSKSSIEKDGPAESSRPPNYTMSYTTSIGTGKPVIAENMKRKKGQLSLSQL